MRTDHSSRGDVAVGQVPTAVPPLWKGGVFSVAAGLAALELAVSARYGFHRDELYFLACARHLAWGYVDQPPLVPAVAWLAVHLFGTSASALRVFPAIAAGATVVLTALMARELGGRRKAQLLAALAAATSPQVVSTFHLLSTAAFDVLFWAAICYLVLRYLRRGDPRLWLVIGVVAGFGLLNKLNVIFLLVGLISGLLLAGRGWDLWSPWVLGGVVAGLAIWSPNVIWNAQHHWATVSMLHSLHRENSGLGASIGFIPSQLIVVGPVLLVLWLAGLRTLLRSPFAKPLGVAFLVLVGLFTLGGAKSYYLAGMYFVLFAAGAKWSEDRLDSRRPARGVGGWILLMAAGLVIALPLTLPVLSQKTLPTGSWEGNINKDLSATLGWQDFVRQVAAVSGGLPPSERGDLVVFTGDYGAAGAIDLWGPRYGLPRAVSGHNNYWWWGPAGARDGATTIAVNLPRSYLLTIFSQVNPAGAVETPGRAWTEERGVPIWICRGQKETWAQAWPAARHYG
jgi:Dolichyl-phosphate-mannose-protein mannosyltransferase